jgi:predicted transcriptional regulator
MTTVIVMKERQKIGAAELEVLHFIQEHHPVTVREVADHFATSKGQVRTTLLNVMERLRKKGFLTRKKTGGVFHYSPRVSKTELLNRLVRDFVDRTLGGSVAPFMAYLVRDANLTGDEVRELKRIVRELEEGP